MKTLRRSGAFTVIELLAVIVLITVLAIVFLPSLQSARFDAQTKLCQENLRQIGSAAAMFAADSGRFPGCQHEPPSWVDSLAAYGSIQRFACPQDLPTARATAQRGKRHDWTYALNDFLTPHPFGAPRLDFSRLQSVPSPAETIMFAEAAEEYRRYDHFHFADALDNGFTPEAFAEQVDVELHENAANYLFIDGRVDELGWSTSAKPKLMFPNSKFVHPAGESNARQMARR
jgi:prepilin-type processing-associated H-X9-DG protein